LGDDRGSWLCAGRELLDRVSLLDLQAVQVWPGVRRAGLQRLSGGADAGPGAAQRRRLIQERPNSATDQLT
jgi:hypothetical protein